MFAQNVLSSHLYGHTVVKVFDLTAHPPDYVRFRANGSHQADGAVARVCAARLRFARLIRRAVGRRGNISVVEQSTRAMEEYHLLSSLRPNETLEILYGSEGVH
jgi:hypothetical protein